MTKSEMHEIIHLLNGSLQIEDGQPVLKDAARLRENIHRLAEVSALESGPRQGYARYLTRLAAQASGIYLASINDLYMARGRGESPPISPSRPSTCAPSLSRLPKPSSAPPFRWTPGRFIFEIARSEMGYTDQRPAEYVTSVLAAAIAEGFSGPVFMQGDHFQVSGKRYASDPETELQAVRDLIQEAIRPVFIISISIPPPWWT
jgi:hypothetical protein